MRHPAVDFDFQVFYVPIRVFTFRVTFGITSADQVERRIGFLDKLCQIAGMLKILFGRDAGGDIPAQSQNISDIAFFQLAQCFRNFPPIGIDACQMGNRFDMIGCQD